MSNHFTFGAAYFPVLRDVPTDLESDLARMHDTGFEEVRSGAVWRGIERRRGQFDFSVLDRVLEAADKQGMTVMLSIHLPPPTWFLREHAGTGVVTRLGQPAIPRSRNAVCWDNPHFREYAGDFIEGVAQRYRDAAALRYWNAWNEPNLIGGSPVYPSVEYSQITCYCDYTSELFREWLRSRYGDVHALNETWRADYEDWTQVSPPDGVLYQWGSYPAWLDWRDYADDRLTDAVRWVADTIKKHDDTHPTHTNLLFQSAVYNPTILGSDVAKLASVVDIVGASAYAMSTAGDHPELLSQTVDVLRSAGSRHGHPCWISEFQGGPTIWAHDKAVVPTPEDLYLAPFQAVAHGAKGFWFWMWRPRMDLEVGGWENAEFGLVGKDGSLRDRAISAGSAARAIRDNADLLMSATCAPKVAILRSQAIYHAAFAELLDEVGRTASTPNGDPRRFYTDSILGAYRLFWEDKVAVGFVTPDDVLHGALEDYSVLVMPFTYLLGADTTRKVAEFVADGGTVLADFGCAMKDGRGNVYPHSPGGALREVFGAEEYDLATDDVPFQQVRAEGEEEQSLHIPRPHGLRAIIRPDADTQIVATYDDGTPAVVANKFGHGRAILVGSLLFHSYQATSNPSLRTLVRTLIGATHPAYDVDVTDVPDGDRARIEVGRLTSSEADVLIVINHQAHPVRCTVAVRGDDVAVWDLLDKRSVESRHSRGRVMIPMLMKAKSVAMLRLGDVR
ncbi:MAG: beta-galactosidase [Nocardioidaceae bacterium]|nr:beta-galactosidase [Nocardioidaceae bacterium]